MCKDNTFHIIHTIIATIFHIIRTINAQKKSHNPYYKRSKNSHNRTIGVRFFILIGSISLTTKTENSQLNALNNNKIILP